MKIHLKVTVPVRVFFPLLAARVLTARFVGTWGVEAYNAVELSSKVPSPHGGNAVELATAVDRNKPAPAGVSGELAGRMPETVASRPYSGLLLHQILNSTTLPHGGGQVKSEASPPFGRPHPRVPFASLLPPWGEGVNSTALGEA